MIMAERDSNCMVSRYVFFNIPAGAWQTQWDHRKHQNVCNMSIQPADFLCEGKFMLHSNTRGRGQSQGSECDRSHERSCVLHWDLSDKPKDSNSEQSWGNHVALIHQVTGVGARVSRTHVDISQNYLSGSPLDLLGWGKLVWFREFPLHENHSSLRILTSANIEVFNKIPY